MRGQGMPPSLVRPERAPTRQPTINLGLGMKSSAEKDPPRKKSAERFGELRSRCMEIAVKLPISPDLGVQRSILPLTSSKRFAALPVWLEFAIALSAFSVSVFSISALSTLPFPRPPIFATSFAKASSYAKASADKTADKTAVRKAMTGRPARPNGSFRSLPQKANS